MRSLMLACLCFVMTAAPVGAALHTETVEYQDGDQVLEGYLAHDDASQVKRPGVLVVHEWKGLNDYAKHRAEQLVQLGYVAFAADIYGKGIRAKDHDEAAKLSGVYRNDRALMRRRAQAALAVLRSQPMTDPEKLAAIGYCFGGMTVLELARSGADLDGVVTFHGGLSTPHPEDARNIKAKVLIQHGGDDKFVTPEELAALKKEMDAAGVDYRVIVYPGAVHSFTVPEAGNDPSTGMAYNAEADRQSWQAMLEFFKDIFGQATTGGLAQSQPS